MTLRKYLHITLGIILLLFVSNILLNVVSYPAMVRPVKLRVVDSVTNLPIGNIPIYYLVNSDKLFIIPRPDPKIVYEYNLVRKYFTNSNGEVMIPKNRIAIKLNKRIYMEEIFINMYVKEQYRKDDIRIEQLYGINNDMFTLSLMGQSLDSRFLMNPVEEYNGGIIVNTKYIAGTKPYTEIDEIGFFRYAEGRLRYDEDQYIIKLARKKTNW